MAKDIIRKPIRRDGKVIGWRLYSKSKGMFGSPSFIGYKWKNPKKKR